MRQFLILLAVPVVVAIAPSTGAQTAPSTVTQSPTQTAKTTQQQIAEQFADLVISGQYEDARQYLHPVLATDWTADVLEERWTTFQNRTGAFVRRDDSRMIGQLVFITAEFTDLSEDLIFIFDEEQRITGVDFPLQPMRFVNE